jgi:hypothetical protein
MSDDFNSGISRVTGIIGGVARSLVSLLLALFVLFVFVKVLFPTTAFAGDPIKGLMDLIDSFVTKGFTGLLALVFFVGFLTNGKWHD